MANTTTIVVTSLYLIITMGIAIYYGRVKTESQNDYTVGGRSLGNVVMFFTLLATVIGASTVLGGAEWYYERGFAQIWYILGLSITYLLYIFYLGPKINEFGHKHGGETVSDWMEHRYGKVAKYISSIFIIVAYIAITAFQYMAMANILSFVTGFSYEISLVITSVVVITYTSLGGFWAVATTDVMQGAMTLLGIIILMPITLSNAGGFSAVIASLPAKHLDLFGNIDFFGAISSTLVFALGIVSWPDIWQRCYAAKNKKILQKSFGLFVIANLVISVCVMFIAFSAMKLYPGYVTGSRELLPFVVLNQLPNVLGAVIISSLIAVIMGTADSTLFVSSVMIEKDLLGKYLDKKSDTERKKISTIITFICGVAVLVVLFLSSDMFGIWIMSADITGATLAVPILLGMAWKKPTSVACVASIVAGFAGWLASYTGLVAIDAIILGSSLSLIAYLVATFISPTEKIEDVSLIEKAGH